jgi:hypothetical protein
VFAGDEALVVPSVASAPKVPVSEWLTLVGDDRTAGGDGLRGEYEFLSYVGAR